MDALVEVHTSDEMKRATRATAKLIGVNNRDLRTFEVSLETSLRLAAEAPQESVLVSESGLNSRADLELLHAAGYRGFLIGETLMRADHPEEMLRDLRDSTMTFIKICGITNLEDARAAVAAGADALGFNFYNLSPRYITPQAAREIIEQLPDHVLMVGVFVSEPMKSVRSVANESGVTALQLHGDEPADYSRELARDYCVIKTLAVSDQFNVYRAQEYQVDAIMLDTGDNRLRGGTGRSFDWSIAQQVNQLVPKLFLAGGLSPENIAEAIETVRPYAVDACSALEDTPGKKNHERMDAFVKVARGVNP